MKNYCRKSVIGILPILISSYCFADVIPFDSEQWEFNAKTAVVEEYLGQQSLTLNSGFATIDAEFTNGIIEFDVVFEKEVYQSNKGFIAAVFRLQDESEYEKFYMRPHRMNGEQDASQLIPVYNHWSSWELYWEGHFAPIQFVYDEWMHIKLVVSGEYAEVYAIDMDTPVLSTILKREIQPGKIGVKSDPSAPNGIAHFANFDYTIEDSPTLKNPPELTTAPAGTIMSWAISEPFEASELDGQMTLTESSQEWVEWAADSTAGVMNLAKTHHIDTDPPNKKPGADTVFARTTIVSDKDQTKKLQFGFTDLVKVYLNGKLMYSENNSFGSRDYRFMGLMRYSNELYLPLQEGENDLTLAVTGLFASWGVQARLNDLEGVELNAAGESFAFNEKTTDDSCVASYSADGKLHIPCVDVAGTTYEVDMYGSAPDFNFALDMDSITAK